MKKVFSMAAIALFMMTSCSSDDDNNPTNNTNPVLVTQMTYIEDGDAPVTANYTYDGNKIIKVTYNDGTYEDYTYNSNNKITNIKTYDSGEVVEESNFTYNASGQLSSEVSLEGSLGYKTEYTYNNDGTISYVDYEGSIESQTLLTASGTITITNGNITQEIIVDDTPQTWSYTYDNKNNPFKNIASAMELLLYNGGSEIGGIVNNVTTLIVDYSELEEDEVYTTTYTYNAQNYPTQSVEVDSAFPNEPYITTTYTYNQ